MGDPSRAERYPFSVITLDGVVAITMDTGGVSRVRHVAPVLLAVGDACRALLDGARERIPDASRVPFYPEYVRIVTGDLAGVCRITVGCHRLAGGDVERVVALYDEGDDTAPVLVLIEEQIDEFLRQT